MFTRNDSQNAREKHENSGMRIYQFLSDEEAATSIEYAVLLAMIIMVCLLGIGQFGVAQNGVWNTILDAWDAFIG